MLSSSDIDEDETPVKANSKLDKVAIIKDVRDKHFVILQPIMKTDHDDARKQIGATEAMLTELCSSN